MPLTTTNQNIQSSYTGRSQGFHRGEMEKDLQCGGLQENIERFFGGRKY